MKDKKDWNTKEDPLFDKFNELTIGKIAQIEGGLAAKGRFVSEKEKNLKREKMLGVNKGKFPNEEVRQKMSKAQKEREIPSNLGKKLDDKWRENISKGGLKPYAIYEGQTYTALGLAEKLGFEHYTKVSQIKSGKKKDEWGITFLETTVHKKESKPRNNLAHRLEVLNRPYAILNGETLTLTELSEKTEFNKLKIAHIKAGRTKNYLGITFL
jgi:hypothetical protein